MLNIFLGEMKDAIYHPPTYFDNVYEDAVSYTHLTLPTTSRV